MKLNHIGLNIQSEEEVVNFYQNILDFQPEYQFEMPADLCNSVFELNKPAKVFLYKKDDVLIELFACSEDLKMGFAHICIDVIDRELLAAKSEAAGYPIIRIHRDDKPDLLFLKDKAGNMFELKNMYK